MFISERLVGKNCVIQLKHEWIACHQDVSGNVRLMVHQNDKGQQTAVPMPFLAGKISAIDDNGSDAAVVVDCLDPGGKTIEVTIDTANVLAISVAGEKKLVALIG